MNKKNNNMSKLSICLVSNKIDGPDGQAGQWLAEAGHDVTLLYTDRARCDQQALNSLTQSCKEKNIKLVVLPETAVPLETPIASIGPS